MRYADDFVVLARYQGKRLINWVEWIIEGRLGLTINRDKTSIVRLNQPGESLDFLGFTFQPRLVRGPYVGIFVGFTPAISNKATKAIRDEIRRWRLHRRTQQSLEDFSRMYNPIIRGWVNYYGSFYKSKLYDVFNPLNLTLARWAMRKYKKLRGHQRRAGRDLL